MWYPGQEGWGSTESARLSCMCERRLARASFQAGPWWLWADFRTSCQGRGPALAGWWENVSAHPVLPEECFPPPSRGKPPSRYSDCCQSLHNPRSNAQLRHQIPTEWLYQRGPLPALSKSHPASWAVQSAPISICSPAKRILRRCNTRPLDPAILRPHPMWPPVPVWCLPSTHSKSGRYILPEASGIRLNHQSQIPHRYGCSSIYSRMCPGASAKGILAPRTILRGCLSNIDPLDLFQFFQCITSVSAGSIL